MKSFARRFYLFLIVLFLYMPIFVLIVASFNDSKILGTWKGFTLHWYRDFFENATMMNALRTTLVIALLSATIATVLGTLACMTMAKMKKSTKNIIVGITNIPMLNAEIVTALAFMLLFIGLGVSLSFSTVLIAHVTFCIPYVVLNVLPKVQQMDSNMYEAALDLGATPIQAFFLVTVPEIMPGILSGFLMSFTMSIDDFIITHFTRGSGINTLSTMIYTEVRKGIKPEMYALSTLLFVTVFILLFLVNYGPKSKSTKKHKSLTQLMFKNKYTIAVSVCVVIIVGIFGYQLLKDDKEYIGDVYVYNWGEYIDPEVIELFEEETGYKVHYEEFETNEEMFTIVDKKARVYDVICPSDYMIEKMLENDLLTEINFDNIPNLEHIGKQYLESAKGFDPENKYCVPYCWGTVGICYNKNMVNEEVNSWSILFDEKYDGKILMQASVRDAYCVALSYLGYSINTLNEDELKEATDLLVSQKPIVQAYVVDQVRDKMIKNAAALAVIYSGEAIYMQEENDALEYVVPDEGSNVWIDGWVIPKDCQNKEAAEAWINFLCRPDIALMNFEYITYSTPNESARALIEDEDIKNSQIAFPDNSVLSRCEVYNYLGTEGDNLYDYYWTIVGGAESD
ncbi:MAG: extracellular solute-binding protein [Lachnospiraceae bacterium]|nr:extracellular solute-binding protein [Lachnospiraceae bacterium]